MAKTKRALKVVWAIDILTQGKKTKTVSQSLLKAVSRKVDLEVVAVYIVRIAEQVTPFTHGEGKKVFLENVRSAMRRWLEGTSSNVSKILPVLQTGIYLRSDVDALVSVSKKERADLILVNTHARKGFSRFWMGSFAETVMYHSTLPVLFLNPESKAITQIKNILVPTNLAPGSEKNLTQIAELAKRMGSQLVLYNNIEYFVATPGLSFTETTMFVQNIDRNMKSRKKSLEQIAHRLEKRHGISVKTVVDEKDLRVSEGIIKLSKKLPACMIGMLAQTGPVMSVLVGSTTRRVVREADVPVLVFR